MERTLPKVGVGVIIKKDGMVLLGKRRGAHDEGTWSFPGGHLEFNEKIFDCAIREVEEEVGLNIANLKLGPYTNDFFIRDKKHYITLYVTCDWQGGDPVVLEKDKCDEWRWFAWDRLPDPLMVPVHNLIKTEFDPFA